MNDETKISVSNMVRLTSENSSKFWAEIADHIDQLEETIVRLNNRILELESPNENSDEA